MIGHSPCISVRSPPEPSHELRFPNAREVAELAAAIGPDYEPSSTRPPTPASLGELAGLRRKHANLMRWTITVVEQLTDVNGTLAFGPPKTKAGQTARPSIPLAPSRRVPQDVRKRPELLGADRNSIAVLAWGFVPMSRDHAALGALCKQEVVGSLQGPTERETHRDGVDPRQARARQSPFSHRTR